jgi:hypothetical protein
LDETVAILVKAVVQQGILPPGAKYLNYEEKKIIYKKFQLEIAAPVKGLPVSKAS